MSARRHPFAINEVIDTGDYRDLLRPETRMKLEHKEALRRNMQLVEQGMTRQQRITRRKMAKAQMVLEKWADVVVGRPKVRTLKSEKAPPDDPINAIRAQWIVQTTPGYFDVVDSLIEWFKGAATDEQAWASMEFTEVLARTIDARLSERITDSTVIGRDAMVALKDAADLVQLSAEYVRQSCVDGEIPGSMQNSQGRWYIPFGPLCDWAHRPNRRSLKKSKKIA